MALSGGASFYVKKYFEIVYFCSMKNITIQMKKGATIDAEKQTYVALDAFQKNGFFMLVNDYQVGDLHEEILVDEHTKVSFVRLTPLVGG